MLIGGTEGKTILAMNNKKKPLDDLRVRQAIAYAIDRKAIIDGAMNGLGTPIGSHLTPNDPGYVDLTGEYPHDPAKSKALLKAAGVTTPLQLTLTLPPPDYARKGGEIIAAELAEVGIEAKIENVEWAQWLSNVYTGKNYDLTIISHVEPLDIGIYAKPGYYFQYDNQDFRDSSRKLSAAPDLDAYKKAHRRGAAQARRRLRQRVPVPVAERHHRRRESERPLEERADLRQRSLGAVLEVGQISAQSERAALCALRRPGCCNRREARLRAIAEAMRPHQLSAVALLDAFAAASSRRVEAMRDVLDRVARVRAAYPRHLSLAPERALADARASEARWAKGEPIGPLDGVPATIKDNIATTGRAEPARHGGERSDARRRRRAAGGAAARSRRDPVRQDDDARLRHAVVGPFELSSADAQPVGPQPQSRRLVRGRGRGGGGGLRAAASGHRHRRLGAAARGLVRPLRPEAERGARADRSALSSAASPDR